MANQILAGAVVQAGMVIAGVDADNPPYVGPPVPTYLVVRVAEGDKTSGSYPYQDRLYLYDVYNIESDPIVVNNPNGDDANQWNNYSDGFGNPNTVITSGSQQLFVGAPLEDFGGLGNQGGVYVYDKSDLTTPVTTMTSPTPSENGYFGRSVATNDTHLFVSEQGDQTLYIYDLSDLSASPTVISDTRPAANSQWNFAAQMHVTNTHLVIGDDNYDTSSASYNHGSVSIYDLSDLSSPIHLTDQDLQGACSWMGLRISNDGSQFYVGVNASWNPDNSAIHYGQMQIRDIATGNLVSTITYPAPNGNYAAFAGYIEETDDKFILSAMLEEVGGDGQQGRVYVYDKSNLSSPSTIITSPLTGDNTDSGSDRFGASLVTDDNYLYVSDRGSAGAGSSYAIWGAPGAYVWRYDLSDLSATPYQITEPAVDRAEHIQQFGTFIHMVQFPFPVTESSSLGDPFPHAGDIKATGAPSPFYAHYADANDWLTYGVFTDQPYDSVSNRPRIVPDGTPAGAVHFLRYDLDNEMLYAYASYATSGGIAQVLEDTGFGSGYGLFYSFWQNGGANTGAAPMSSGYFMTGLKKSMTEAEFDALEFYWDEDGGQAGQGSWRINPDVVPPTQPVPATSVTDASFYSVTASDGQEVTHGARRDIGGQWISYGLGEGWFGDHGGREKIIEDGTWTEGAIHYLRYDPISKRIWAFWSYEGTPGAYGTLEQYGFGGYSVNDENAFFDTYKSTNMTDFHFFPSGYFGKMIGSKNQYEVEDLAGLGISWNGTSWTKS